MVNLNDRMMRKLYLVLFVFSTLLLANSSKAQQGQIGTWTDFLPYKNGIALEEMNGKMYCATKYSLYYYDLTDNSTGSFSTVNGLHDVVVSCFKKHPDRDIALLVYENGNIDILEDGRFINLPYIKNADIIGNREVYNITFEGDYAYLSTGFGVVKINLVKYEIADTWKLAILTEEEDSKAKNKVVFQRAPLAELKDIQFKAGQLDKDQQLEILNIHDFLINDTSYVAATNQGLIYTRKDSGAPENFNNWNTYETPYNDSVYSFVKGFGDRLVILKGDHNYSNLYIGTAGNYEEYNFTIDGAAVKHPRINSVDVQDDKLLITADMYYWVLDKDLNILYEQNIWYLKPSDIYLRGKEEVWTADRVRGIIKNIGSKYEQSYNINSPNSTSTYKIIHNGDKVYISKGGHTPTWAALYSGADIFEYNMENGQWTNFSSLDITDGFRDFVNMASPSGDPNRVFVGQWGGDLIEYKDHKVVNKYNETNSSLQKWNKLGRIIVSGLGYDSKGNLWVLNSGAENALSVMTPKGEWQNFPIGHGTSEGYSADLMIDKNDQKWILPRTGSIVVVGRDYPEDPTQITSLSSTVNKIPGNKILSVASDKNGDVWVGTNDGICVFYNPTQIHESVQLAQRINVEIDGMPGYLLAGESVNSISVDGGNRKWIATDGSGVFLFSPDGKELIHHFDESNSPIYSNRVLNIDVNDDGLVFMGTANGIIAYRSDDSKGEETNKDVHTFPNPVKPNYNGPIAIKGLVDDAIVKITDSNGVLVYSTQALGGQAIWNGRTNNGRKVSSGVYLVFITDKTGEETEVTKILFLK